MQRGYLRLTVLFAGCLPAAALPPDPPVGVMRRPGDVPPPATPVELNPPHRFAAPPPVVTVRDAGPGYPVWPTFRSASGGPIVVSWFSPRTGFHPAVVVPYWPELTLHIALELALVPPVRRRVRLLRAGETYQLPRGAVPDPVLAPGDEITVVAD